MAGETDFAMDAKAHIKGADIKGRLPGRHVTEGSRAPTRHLRRMGLSGGSINAAPHPAKEVAEIFKKTPCAAGLKLRGRYLAKDIYDVGNIPLLMKTLLDNGPLDGDCTTVTGQTIAENLKSVKPIAITGGVVDVMGNLAPEGAIVKAAGMLQDGDIKIDCEVRASNVKLSDAKLAEHETKWQPRATNHTAGALWKAVDSAVIYPGGAHEKQCYADI
jgi:dihydroxyacid dehydratase/phosphogluconate dehydratase